MKISIKKFASELPCILKDYEFTGLSDQERRLLGTSNLREFKITSKGKYVDFNGCVSLDALVIIRQKDGIHLIFRMLIKDGKKSYEPIEGFTCPQYPELFLTNDESIYAFNATPAPRKYDWKFDAKNLPKYLVSEDLGGGYVLYRGVMTPITKQGLGVDESVIPEGVLDQVQDLWDKNHNDHSALTFSMIARGEDYKISAAVISLHTQRIYDSFVAKGGNPNGFTGIDLHSHLVPGVDDGSGSEKESIELSQDLKDLGITEIILTPHDNENFDPTPRQESQYENLKEDLDKMDIKSKLSNEHKVNAEFMDSIHIDKGLRTHPNGYLLLEFSRDEDREYILENIAKCLAYYYPKVIFAHPCRYKNLTPYDIRTISGAGALIQCNIKSLDEESQDKDVISKLKTLIEEDLVDVISTDTHHEEHIEQTKDHIDAFKNCITFNEVFKI